MRYKIIGITALAGLGLSAWGGAASAAALACVTGSNQVTVDSASACAATPGQNDEQVDEDTLVFQPGNLGPFDWTYLDKDNKSDGSLLDDENNQIAGANENWFTGTINVGSGDLGGTFTINVAAYSGIGFNTFMLYVKAGQDGAYFLLDGPVVNGLLNGTWSISGAPDCTKPNGQPCSANGISHASLYGQYVDVPPPPPTDVPEPGSLALLGLGLAGLGMARRRQIA